MNTNTTPTKGANPLLRIWHFIVEFFGFSKKTKYENLYLNESNIKSGVFMGLVISALEVWLIIRQMIKHVAPNVQTWAENGVLWKYVEANLSIFVLFFLVGLTISVFSVCFRSTKMSAKKKMIINICFSVPTLLFCINAFFDSYSAWGPWDTAMKGNLGNTLLIVLYVLAFIISSLSLADALLTYFKGNSHPVITNSVIIVFAAMCFAFGIKVSYNDYISSSQQKEIICFLTMVVYGGALLIWRPYITIIVNVGLFTAFYQLIIHAKQPEGYKPFNDSDLINYITFLVALTAVCISIYHGRLREAKRAENLEYLARYDELTGLVNATFFSKEVAEKISLDPHLCDSHVILYANLVGLKNYNEKKGFERGNKLLKDLARMLEEAFSDGLCCRQADDHFLVFCPRDNYVERINSLDSRLHDYDDSLTLHLICGCYQPHPGDDIFLASDKARYACSVLGHDRSKTVAEYDAKIDHDVHLREYVVNNLDRAIAEGWIRPHFQPVVWSKDGDLCGVEALARWIDPVHGFMSPGLFIPVLENTKLVYKVDAYILECVCKNLRELLNRGKRIVSCSVNFSRTDFECMDIASLLDEMTSKYDIPKEFLHVEVTESALTDEDGLNSMAEVLNNLKDRGYSLWLDDFGSGYSSLNSLKDFRFDVMKIDLKFLEGFDKNEKCRPLIDSVITLAQRLGMRTLCEGVETDEQREFLKKAGCERLQGYLFGKAISHEELVAKIDGGELKLSDDVL